MSEHYYTHQPSSAHREREIRDATLGIEMRFFTDAGVFSRDEVDPGSRLLIKTAPPLTGRALDLGCGWGAVGLTLARKNPEARFVLSDVNERALELARRNGKINGVANAEFILSDGFEALTGSFDHILTNPPIRAGKKVIYALFDEGFHRLNPGGELLLVIRKQQGAPSALAHLREVFPRAEVIERGGGYWIIRCEKEEAQ